MLYTMPSVAATSVSSMENYKINKPKSKPRTTLEEKIMILNHYHKSNKSQADTVEFFKNRYSISTSSFSEWLKDEEALRNLYNNSNEFLKKSKRKLRFKYDKINEEMDKLVEERIKSKKPINEPFLRENWAIFANKYGVEDPKRLLSFSHGWLSQFKKRHGLDKQSRMLQKNLLNCELVELQSEDSNIISNIAVDSNSNEQNLSIEELIKEDHESTTNQSSEIEQLNINQISMKLSSSQSQQFGSGNFLNMEINEDYINFQTNINNYETLLYNNNKPLNNMTNIPQQSQPQSQSGSVPHSVPAAMTKERQSTLGTQTIRPFNTTFDQLNSNDNYAPVELVMNEDITEEFEIFLNKYGENFLKMNQDKYPESFKILIRLRNVFKKEKEIYDDRKLRELLSTRR